MGPISKPDAKATSLYAKKHFLIAKMQQLTPYDPLMDLQISKINPKLILNQPERQ